MFECYVQKGAFFMPIYVYRCPSCSFDFDRMLKVEDRDQAQLCPKCETEAIRRISGGHFELKGGGWYKDGYAKPK